MLVFIKSPSVHSSNERENEKLYIIVLSIKKRETNIEHLLYLQLD